MPFLKVYTNQDVLKIVIHILISGESSFCPTMWPNVEMHPLANGLSKDIQLWLRAHGHEDTRKYKHCRSSHIICSLIYCIFGRQCSKLPCIYGQLGHLWWSTVDRSIAHGNAVAIIRNHGKSDSCINGYSLLWYFKMSMRHHKLSKEKNLKMWGEARTLLYTAL